MKFRKVFLLINPHIEDFAAYDHFSKPLGLITLASYLRTKADVFFINALRHDANDKINPDGTGPFTSKKIPAPSSLSDIHRKFKRFGISDKHFLSALRTLPQKPDYILVTSLMTYWYGGIIHTLSLIRSVFPDVPVILGGVYATLLPSHAKSLPGVDITVSTQDLRASLKTLSQITGIEFDASEVLPPAYDLLGEYRYLPVQTSSGCVFRCNYCASSYLHAFKQDNPRYVAQAILDAHYKFNVERFAFYDDALLVGSEEHIDRILKNIIEANAGLKFYTPNGLHIRFLTDHTANLMKKSGFQDIRLSLESVNPEFMQSEGAKNTLNEFYAAVDRLHEAGFARNQIRVYTLANVPGQDPKGILQTVKTAYNAGALPYLAFYSPVPHTSDFTRAAALTDLSDPLFHNNTVYLYRSGFDLSFYQELKHLVREYRVAENTKTE